MSLHFVEVGSAMERNWNWAVHSTLSCLLLRKPHTEVDILLVLRILLGKLDLRHLLPQVEAVVVGRGSLVLLWYRYNCPSWDLFHSQDHCSLKADNQM